MSRRRREREERRHFFEDLDFWLGLAALIGALVFALLPALKG